MWWKKRMKKKSVDNEQLQKRSINDPNEVNDTVEIPVYAPNLGLSPKEYQISPQLYSLEMNIQSICEEFLNKAKPDEFNSSYMDAIIERTCVECIKYIEVQRKDHERLIRGVLKHMHDGDYTYAKNKLVQFVKDKECMERELRKLQRIYWKGTSMSEEEEMNYGYSE